MLGGICGFLKKCWVEELCGNTWIAVFMLHLRWSAYLASFAFLISLIMLTFYICYCNCTEICTYERALQYNMASLQITVSRHIKLKSRTRRNLNIIIVYHLILKGNILLLFGIVFIFSVPLPYELPISVREESGRL